MKSIYLNWAATSNQKFPETIAEVCAYLQKNNSVNLGRNMDHIEMTSIALDTRLILQELFNVGDASQVVFTPNVTTALNMVLNGLLQSGDHVITTSVEHNAVARPLHLLEQTIGLEVTYLACEADGKLDPELVSSAIQKNTKALVMTHASNVLGTILPVTECFAIAKKHGLITILDSAQTAGYLPLDMEKMQIDILCFTGHKSLMALAGSGGFALRSGIADLIRPWLTGGTGSVSESLEQPNFLPDKFEPGTENLLGIISLRSAVEQIQKIGLDAIRSHEEELTASFLAGLADLPVRVLGTGSAQKSVPVVSIVPDKLDPAELSQSLFEEYGIVTRCGLHCAPLAHQTAGSFKTGATRFSFGYFTTFEEIDDALKALRKILK